MTWTEIGSVASESSKNTRYAISVNTEGDLGCKCMSYAHSKEVPKVCKHVQSRDAGILLQAYQESLKPKAFKFQVGYYNWHQRVVGVNELSKAESVIAAARDLLRNGYGIVSRSKLDTALRNLGA